MIRTIVSRSIPATRVTYRTISTSAIRMAEGDTGATRAGGVASGDSFSKREKANEDMFVKAQERDKLLAMKKKIEEQKSQIKEMEDHVANLERESKK